MLLLILTVVKSFFANGVITFLIKGKPVLSNEPKSLLRNLLDCIILDSWIFDDFILADGLFAKALQTYQLITVYVKK